MQREFKLEEVEDVVKNFLEFIEQPHLTSRINRGGTVLGFSGNLGAGKTTFTKEILKQLGHIGNVASPTFVLRRDYSISPTLALPTSEGVVHNIIHIDAYRLEKPEHIYQVVSKEELEDKNNLVIIEWPEKVATLLPGEKGIFDKIFLFEHIDENTRRVSLK